MPSLLFAVIPLPVEESVFIKLAGMLVVIHGYYCLSVARSSAIGVIKATVWDCGFVLAFIVALVVLGKATPNYLVLGVIDALGGLWTWRALNAQGDW